MKIRSILAVLSVAILLPVSALAQQNKVPLQVLLDKGFRVVATSGGGAPTQDGVYIAVIVQKDNQVFGCDDYHGNVKEYSDHHLVCVALH